MCLRSQAPFLRTGEDEDDQMENCSSRRWRGVTSPFPSSLHEEKGRACGTAMTSPRQNSAGSRALPRTVCGLRDVDCRFHKHRCPPPT